MSSIGQKSRDDRPKVAQILYSGLGGHGGVVFGLINSDKGRRWNDSLVFVGIEPILPDYVSACERDGIRYWGVQATAGRPWRNYRPIYRALQSARPDAILMHSSTALPPCALYARRHDIPLIFVEHQANHLKSRQEWLFSRLGMRWADAIVFLTDDHRAEVATKIGRRFSGSKAVVISNGVDTERFRGAAPLAGDRQKTIRIGMAGRFSAIKRFDVLTEALGDLCDRAPDRSWHLTLAGAGEDFEDVVRRADKLRYRSQISFEGMLSDRAFADWYRSLDIYCHASDGETLSVSVIQAMSAGLPIIGSDVAGISNLLDRDRNMGRLVENSPRAFSDMILSLVEDPDGSRNMGLNAQAEAIGKYDYDRMFADYDRLIRRCMDHG